MKTRPLGPAQYKGAETHVHKCLSVRLLHAAGYTLTKSTEHARCRVQHFTHAPPDKINPAGHGISTSYPTVPNASLLNTRTRLNTKPLLKVAYASLPCISDIDSWHCAVGQICRALALAHLTVAVFHGRRGTIGSWGGTRGGNPVRDVALWMLALFKCRMHSVGQLLVGRASAWSRSR